MQFALKHPEQKCREMGPAGIPCGIFDGLSVLVQTNRGHTDPRHLVYCGRAGRKETYGDEVSR